jgi:hypothetical protein
MIDLLFPKTIVKTLHSNIQGVVIRKGNLGSMPDEELVVEIAWNNGNYSYLFEYQLFDIIPTHTI